MPDKLKTPQYASYSRAWFILLIAAGVMSLVDVAVSIFILKSPLDYITSAILLLFFVWAAKDLKNNKLELVAFKIIRFVAVVVLVGTPFSWWIA